MKFPDCFTRLMDALTSERARQVVRAKIPNSMTTEQREYAEAWVEKVFMLSDKAGRAALNAIRVTMPDVLGDQFDVAGNQFDRILWLYEYHSDLFHNAVDARLADRHRSGLLSSLFRVPRSLRIKTGADIVFAFRTHIAQQLLTSDVDMSINIHERREPGRDGNQIDITIHHNELMEAFNVIEDGRLTTRNVQWAISLSVIFEPTLGLIEVFAKTLSERMLLASLFSQYLLNIEKDDVSLVESQYQHLSGPAQFDISGERVEWVRVTEVGMSYRGRDLAFKANGYSAEDIYSGWNILGSNFRLSEHTLTKVVILIALSEDAYRPAREVSVVLKSKHTRIVNANYRGDRMLCHRLLARWGILKGVGFEQIA